MSRRPTKWLSQLLLTVVALGFLFPFIWMMANALKPSSEVLALPPSLIGSTVRWQNFPEALAYLPFGRFMLNGVIVSALGTIATLITSAMAGYAFARLQFRGREATFLLYLGTLMIPQEVLVVPMFVLMTKLQWVNSYQALILPWAFTAFGTFLLRQFFLTVPKELEEAANIDGAGYWRRFATIVLPLGKPALGVLAVFTFIGLEQLLVAAPGRQRHRPGNRNAGTEYVPRSVRQPMVLPYGGGCRIDAADDTPSHRPSEIPRQGHRPQRTWRALRSRSPREH
ncbi:MAG: transporter permease [Propionibacteriaceae bacterium]|jgi:ABC-type glycerol-3-phosphate transport system permease component|nr:transporter permease [Propionibacteriaceae bacterium]